VCCIDLFGYQYYIAFLDIIKSTLPCLFHVPTKSHVNFSMVVVSETRLLEIRNVWQARVRKKRQSREQDVANHRLVMLFHNRVEVVVPSEEPWHTHFVTERLQNDLQHEFNKRLEAHYKVGEVLHHETLVNVVVADFLRKMYNPCLQIPKRCQTSRCVYKEIQHFEHIAEKLFAHQEIFYNLKKYEEEFKNSARQAEGAMTIDEFDKVLA
jgi:hypothetical protein